MYIAIAGNIGSGKTTLTERLAAHYGAHAHYEDPDNPYIGDFYDAMSRWSFNLQVYFLSSRIQQTKEMLEQKEAEGWSYLFQDRTIYEDAHIFATNLNEMGLLSSRDFATYMKTFQLFEGFLPKPDLLIYLRASVPKLVEQIKKRGREYESNIDSEYLKCLNEKYEHWIENIYKGNLLIIDKDKDDFEEDTDIFKQICDRIESLK
ncbi:MAG: deoxynucleoside kinase [Rikenellaceae bacterium]